MMDPIFSPTYIAKMIKHGSPIAVVISRPYGSLNCETLLRFEPKPPSRDRLPTANSPLNSNSIDIAPKFWQFTMRASDIPCCEVNTHISRSLGTRIVIHNRSKLIHWRHESRLRTAIREIKTMFLIRIGLFTLPFCGDRSKSLSL